MQFEEQIGTSNIFLSLKHFFRVIFTELAPRMTDKAEILNVESAASSTTF